MKKAMPLIIVAACILILLLCYSNQKNNAIYIYDLNGDVQGDTVATLTWDDIEQLKTITNLMNEAFLSDRRCSSAEMEYMIELVNSKTENDFLKIGFVDGMVCCSGNVQGISIDHAVSSSVTEADMRNIIDR